MPFSKNKKQQEDNSLARALGFSDKRADEIIDRAHKLVHEAKNHHKALLELNGRFNDNELLFAAYAYGRIVEGHEDVGDGSPSGKISEELFNAFVELADLLDGKKRS